MPSVAIVGASGYGGTELLRLLARHPSLDVVTVAGSSSAGTTVRSAAPNIPASIGGDVVLDAVDVDGLASADVVVLGTPDEVSLKLAPALVSAGTRVVDLSGAFRLDAATYEGWYGRPHTAPDLAQGGATPAVYGLTEHARGRSATRCSSRTPAATRRRSSCPSSR